MDSFFSIFVSLFRFSKRITVFKIILYFLVTLLSLSDFHPAFAIDDCNNIVSIPDTWKQHFPFDLVYPIGPAYTSDNTCPTITFWGSDRQVCSVPQMTAIVKNLVLAKIAIQGLFQL